MATYIGAVLAGGAARRFGSDKAQATLNGLPLMEHAFNQLTEFVDLTIVCGRDVSGYVCVPDRPRPGMGPLGGLAAALHFARVNGADKVISIGCDTPFVSPRAFSSLIERGGAAFIENLPVIGIWPTALLESLDEFLASDCKHSVWRWARSVDAAAISWDPIPNVNFKDDLTQLEGQLHSR